MNEIHKAYGVLGLDLGTPFKTVKDRYRFLAFTWHPDRMPKVEYKSDAQEQLKRINDAYEKLEAHFQKEHHQGPLCRCQPGAAAFSAKEPNQQGSGPKSNSKSSGTDFDANWWAQQFARQRAEKEQKKRETETEAARKEREEVRKRKEERKSKVQDEMAAREAAAAQRAAKRAKEANPKEELRNNSHDKDEALRWRCTQLIAIVFVVLIGYGWLESITQYISDEIGRQWETATAWMHPKHSKMEQAANQPQILVVDTSMPPYVTPCERLPVSKQRSLRELIEEADNRKQRREQDIKDAKQEVERAQRVIDKCNDDIARINERLSDPYSSGPQRERLLDWRIFQQRNLERAERELLDARYKLERL